MSICSIRSKYQNGSKQRFSIDFTHIKDDVQKIVFSITIHNAEEKKQALRDVTHIQLKISNAQSGLEIIHFPITHPFTDESAIIVGELYRHGEDGSSILLELAILVG